MPSFTEAIDARINQYKYRLKKIRTPHGDLHECPEGDEDVEFILTWRGTGEIKKFTDILEEHLKHNFEIIIAIKNKEETEKEHYWLVDYIVKKNYQIVFDPDDIVLRHPHKCI